METLNRHYLTRNRCRSADTPTNGTPADYRVYLRAHLESGYRTPTEQLRREITAEVPALSTLSYQAHVVPLAQQLQQHLEGTLGVRVRSVDVEVQYQP